MVDTRLSGCQGNVSRGWTLNWRQQANALKQIGCGSAGFHTFRRFREAILQMSNARNLLIDFWMGHANSEMGGRYGKQLLANIRWRQEWAATVGLGFTFPANSQESMLDKFGQVFGAEEREAVSL